MLACDRLRVGAIRRASRAAWFRCRRYRLLSPRAEKGYVVWIKRLIHDLLTEERPGGESRGAQPTAGSNMPREGPGEAQASPARGAAAFAGS